ncbi:hypothetical protein J41TS4_21770 [Paenibacillus apis]|uniref:Uncharacterized protein n=1 Tax=Paenibacillus apis TaxID=1792174 RepID=A0A919Y298_9BACL|nr:hypothetical protein J41TS4_21770 [Paenibacillus apis]
MSLTRRLNSNEIDGIATFYHFDNHTKIVLTNNMLHNRKPIFSTKSSHTHS